MNNELIEVYVWPDGTWCEKDELFTMTHMSDDFTLESLSEQEYNDLLNGDLIL